MKKPRMKYSWKTVLGVVLFVLLAGSTVYFFIAWLGAPNDLASAEDVFEKTKSDYALTVLQCLLGLVVMFLPSMIERRFKIDIPNSMEILYLVFLFCAIYLGEAHDFFYRVPHWDVILHGFSGIMLAALGFTIINILNDSKQIQIVLSPFFAAAFAFFFAVTAGVFWEIYEFAFDGILGLNMQKYRLADGTALVGRAALTDTMKDLIVDAVGAFVVSLLGYFQLKAQIWRFPRRGKAPLEAKKPGPAGAEEKDRE